MSESPSTRNLCVEEQEKMAVPSQAERVNPSFFYLFSSAHGGESLAQMLMSSGNTFTDSAEMV